MSIEFIEVDQEEEGSRGLVNVKVDGELILRSSGKPYKLPRVEARRYFCNPAYGKKLATIMRGHEKGKNPPVVEGGGE